MKRCESARISVLRFLRGLFLLGHPLPTVATAVAGAIFFMIAKKAARIDADTLMLFTSVLLIQYSIGCMNDYVDEPLDRQAMRREKPLVATDVSRMTALCLWLSAALLGFVAAACFNAASAGIAVLMWLAGVAYNFRAKRTLLSWLPFVIFFPSLPILSFVAAGHFSDALLLAFPVGGLLSVGLNIANTLPDIERDVAGGVSGFTHRLGRSRALVLLWLLLGATILLMAASPLVIAVRPATLVPGLAAGTLLLTLMITDWLALRSPASIRRTFYFSAVCVVILGSTWIASLP
jgi:4-hydroxybenzoate polyprenyltransferase